MVFSNDRSAEEVKRVNQQLEERHYEFRSNCNDGDGARRKRMPQLGRMARCGRQKLLGRSCNRVASMYLSATAKGPIQRNAPLAKRYLEKACDMNFAPACHNLAVMYKKGDEGVAQSEEKFEEYRKKTSMLIAEAGGMSGVKGT
ncbi:hypothetical protein FI667_g12558, partial [Globisporangium splendens]